MTKATTKKPGAKRTGARAKPLAKAKAPSLDEVIKSGADWLFRRQVPQGYWVGRLATNSTMEAEWVLALWFMGLEAHPVRPRLVKSILREQREDGAWHVYANAPSGDVNATVECYAALRSAGLAADHPALKKARAWIEDKNALQNIRVFTRYWLALIGEWPWSGTPNAPPEVVYFPTWFPFSIYNFACWARATLMPITLLSARRRSRPLSPENRLDELFPQGQGAFDYGLPKRGKTWSWERVFLFADKALHVGQLLRLTPFRSGARARVLEWIIRHQDADGAWGGIQPPWIYSLMALHAEGYAHDHPVMAKGLGALDDPRWRVDEGEASYVQACVSPVWDTVLTLLAAEDCEVKGAKSKQIGKAIDWLLKEQVDWAGDWAKKVKGVEPGGWAFEYENRWYPDVDDTAVALIVLAKFRNDPKWKAKGIEEAIRKGVAWMLAMQCSNGGWAAFDKDNDKAILTKISFCDFGEALDPPSVDVTAHVLEALGRLGFRKNHPAVAKALHWLRDEQEADGSWFGRWGVNYVYGTGAVLPALAEIGEDMSAPYVSRACDWLKERQQKGGGWGETCASYMDAELAGHGQATASQTAWAVMGLLAADRKADRAAIKKGTKYLAEAQKGGTWDEPEYTGTGFPGYGVGLRIDLSEQDLEARLAQGPELSRAFMINYHLYRHYFPLMALGRARKQLKAGHNAGIGDS